MSWPLGIFIGSVVVLLWPKLWAALRAAGRAVRKAGGYLGERRRADAETPAGWDTPDGHAVLALAKAERTGEVPRPPLTGEHPIVPPAVLAEAGAARAVSSPVPVVPGRVPPTQVIYPPGRAYPYNRKHTEDYEPRHYREEEEVDDGPNR